MGSVAPCNALTGNWVAQEIPFAGVGVLTGLDG